MKKLADVLMTLSFLLVLYCVINKFNGQPMAEFGLLRTTTLGGMLFAVYLAQIAILLKLSEKK